MAALRTALWVFFAVCIAIFAMQNRISADMNLWPLPSPNGGPLILSIRVYWLAIVCFLAGSLPMWLLYRATKWRLTRRLESSERALADMRAVAAANTAAASGTASVTPSDSDYNPPPASMMTP